MNIFAVVVLRIKLTIFRVVVPYSFEEGRQMW